MSTPIQQPVFDEAEAKIERVNAAFQQAIDFSIKEQLPLTTVYTMLMFYATDMMDQIRSYRKDVVDAKKDPYDGINRI